MTYIGKSDFYRLFSIFNTDRKVEGLWPLKARFQSLRWHSENLPIFVSNLMTISSQNHDDFSFVDHYMKTSVILQVKKKSRKWKLTQIADGITVIYYSVNVIVIRDIHKDNARNFAVFLTEDIYNLSITSLQNYEKPKFIVLLLFQVGSLRSS